MEAVWKTWKNHFFGHSLEEIPSEEALEMFCKMVTHELHAMNKKARDSCKKYENTKWKKNPKEDANEYTDTEATDFHSLERAKLAKERTARHSAVLRDIPLAESMNLPNKKKARHVSTNVMGDSHAMPVLEQVISVQTKTKNALMEAFLMSSSVHVLGNSPRQE